MTEAELDFNNIEEVSNNFSFKFLNTGIMRDGNIYTVKTVPNYNGRKQLFKDIIIDSVEDKYFIEEDKFKEMKGSKRIKRISKTGHEYIFSEGTMSLIDDLNKPGRTMLTSEGTKNRSTHLIEVKKSDNDIKFRKLTPIECERLNGFDDDWTNTGMKERFRYFCMGNALVVGLVTKMSMELSNIIDKEK
ncbi:DNA cytosine methyltransferase [Clostridium sporogenes]|uniref:DNA cytosine methyltransferase n=1 Tax=Clostridium sporogenes TaxID=1509 RepID=UPI000AC82DB3|nr:DNA cytosine methyltransferase [Clostridium sporogenes]